jgi:hypothetical protein
MSETIAIPAADVNGCYTGMRVRSKWQTSNGAYYNGTIARINRNGTYEINYEDGDQDSEVAIERLFPDPWSSAEEDDEEDNDDVDTDDDDTLNFEELRSMLSLPMSEKMQRQDEVHAQWLAARLRATDKAAHARKQRLESSSLPVTPTETLSTPPPLSTVTNALPTAATPNISAVSPPTPQKTPLLRAASQDPTLNAMEVPNGREYLKDPSGRALSFKQQKEKFREYALKRYHELQRYRRELEEATEVTN